MMTQSEDTFFNKIHSNFPYHDKVACLALIEEAAALGPDSVFKVAEEICRISKEERKSVPLKSLQELLEVAKSKVDHPLKDMVFDVAFEMVQGRELSVQEARVKMETVRKFPGQFASLSIIYFSCNDKQQSLELIWDSIIADWRNNGNPT